jgi:hypothetical protein
MKKVIALITCLVFFLNVHGQSITATYFANIFKDDNLKGSLTSRSFKQIAASTSDKGGFESYIKNGGTPSEEKIFKTGTSVSYLTRNRGYIDKLIAQFTKGFKLARQDDEGETVFYQFTHGTTNVTVNRAKSAGAYSSMMVLQK